MEPHAGPPADCASPPPGLSAMIDAIKPMTRGAVRATPGASVRVSTAGVVLGPAQSAKSDTRRLASDLVTEHLVQALPLPVEAERPVGLEHDLRGLRE